ncbi:MAG: universal stress protein [Oscillatoria sp. PMC 1051.18]|uniref:universal stress protein n=1 Tax=Oscillatoria salina TaxID=331517 RepID=UPI0013BD6743|nr:universal stress protein [Oscillatoria salina]MBZ8179613.1 universal stress protein [Oscillatoria salina IIICB1]MEC4892451.1 universal stress protein [Oscillatoria sp. PMC 1050.18]MEC5028501.1 universal stress protein [Oscillatoria sp. PMC 1051.18]NET90133.1 universal stress protein [Kamptonema sp. SIO1D9]
MSLITTNRVLVPIDFSTESWQALAETRDFVNDSANIYVIHVLPHLNPADPGVAWNTVNDRTRKQNVEKNLLEQLSAPKYQGINYYVAIGDPSSQIIDYAKNENIELIVIPSHGYTGLKRFFLGSVAEKVVRFSHCPVLVLRR